MKMDNTHSANPHHHKDINLSSWDELFQLQGNKDGANYDKLKVWLKTYFNVPKLKPYTKQHKVAKQQYFLIKYWNNEGMPISEELPFKNYEDAYEWLIRMGFEAFELKFVGWK